MGDEVYLRVPGSVSREGPFVIATVVSAGVYTLCYQNGQNFRSGAEIEEKELDDV